MRSFNLTSGIYHIPLELPWSSPAYVNVYLLEDSDGYIMIDCGVNGIEFLKILEQKLFSIGVSFKEIKLLIGTHMHSDHIGQSTAIRELGIPFALYENSIDYLKQYNDWTLRFKELLVYAKNQGAPEYFLNDLKEIRTPEYAGRVTKPDVLLTEGRIKLLKREVITIFTPGHDITEISLLDTSSKIVFSGDHILPKITPFIPTLNGNDDMLSKYDNSLDKILNLEHKLIAPGHGSLIDNPYSRIQQMKSHHQRRTDKILNILKDNQLTGWEVVNLLFPRKLDALNLRLAFQETLAHLKYLEKLNKVVHITNLNFNQWKLSKEN